MVARSQIRRAQNCASSPTMTRSSQRKNSCRQMAGLDSLRRGVRFLGKMAGNYRLESLLGEGAMGEVYLARHAVLGKKVAVKILRQELSSEPTHKSRFFREAKVLSELGHTHLVDVIDFGIVDDTVYLAMELLDGRTLADQLSKIGVTIGEALHIVAQCCDVLAACHEAGVIHRDLKPENVFLLRRGGDRLFVKVLDFGVAKVLNAPAGGARTDPGQIFGTPAYMSPEQAMGRAEIDARADLYALGTMLYEMLVGEVPFESARTLTETLLAQMNRKPDAPSKKNPLVPRSIDALILKALEKEPSARFQSAKEMAQALRAPEEYWLAVPAPTTMRDIPAAELSVAVPGRTLQTTTRRRSTRGGPTPTRRLVPLLSVVAIAIIALGVTAMLWPHPPASPVAQGPKLVDVRIETTPEGATVLRDGIEIGRAPLKLSVRRGTEVRLEFRASGFQPAAKKVLADDNSSVAVLLAPSLSPTISEPQPPVSKVARVQPAPKARTTPPPSVALPPPPIGASDTTEIMKPKWATPPSR